MIRLLMPPGELGEVDPALWLESAGRSRSKKSAASSYRRHSPMPFASGNVTSSTCAELSAPAEHPLRQYTTELARVGFGRSMVALAPIAPRAAVDDSSAMRYNSYMWVRVAHSAAKHRRGVEYIAAGILSFLRTRWPRASLGLRAPTVGQ